MSWSCWPGTESGLDGDVVAAAGTDGGGDDGVVADDGANNNDAMHGPASDDGVDGDRWQRRGCGGSVGASTTDKTDRRPVAVGPHHRPCP